MRRFTRLSNPSSTDPSGCVQKTSFRLCFRSAHSRTRAKLSGILSAYFLATMHACTHAYRLAHAHKWGRRGEHEPTLPANRRAPSPSPPSAPRGPRCARLQHLGEGERGSATRPCDRQHAGRATDRAHTHAGGGTGMNGAGVDCAGGAELVAAAPPEPNDELGVECPCDCGAHGAHQAQFRFESHEATIHRSYWQQIARFARGLMVGAQPSTWIWHSTASVRQRRSGGTVAGERGGRGAPVAGSWCTALTASTFHVSSCLHKGRIK